MLANALQKNIMKIHEINMEAELVMEDYGGRTENCIIFKHYNRSK